ncbi:MAG: 4Fe-4S dicluster domain-containing protein [Planctomycetota bacterium]
MQPTVSSADAARWPVPSTSTSSTDRKANAADCIQCGRCEMACTQHLDIINRLNQIAEWEQTLKK